ncbi:YSIRK-type signal peptide-containing protein [Streptococcus sp. A18]|uniref:mucin-binding protein n=1 Tax=Streptococcus sp. A18 TaxID=3373125 RepID=UPI00374D5B17
MRKNNRKSFNWYGMRQHFSIRKYHFGAASVLLGMSLALGVGGQAVKAEETVASSEALASTTATSSTQASSEVVPATSVETAATETVASTTPAATTTEVAATERAATINYIVQYLLEDGTLVEAVVKSATVTTTDVTAKTTVEVVAELPEGYELATDQASAVSQEVTEGAENVVTVKVVKKAEVAATTTEAPAATTTATETAAPATTTEAATDATEVSVPVTAEEAKVVLGQVTSEAEVLANEAERLVAASDSDNTALKAAAAATKLSATEATTVLRDSLATLDQVNAQIDAVRTNVEALALELRKFLGTDDIEIALNTSLSDLGVGQGTGVLVETGTTATPSMDDANGAGIKPHTLRNGVAATDQTGWYTFEAYDFLAYNENQPTVYIQGAPIDAYVRYSLDSNANTSTVLAELVSTTSGQVLETHTLEQGASATLTYPQTVNSNNEIVTLTYDATTATEGSTQGMVVVKGTNKDGNVVLYNYTIVPDYQINTTRYVVEDGTVLATYSLQTISGQPVTPSGQREFSGYAYKSTTKEVVQGGLPAGTVYMAGKVDEKTVHYKAIRKVISDTQIVIEYYFLDPTYTGTVDWEGTDTTGFIKFVETSPLTYTDGKTYDYNKNPKIYAPYTNDDASGYMVFKESPVNEQGSKYRVVAQWSGSGEAGKYGRIFIGTQVYTHAQASGDPEFKWRGVNDKFDNLGYVPFGIQQNLRNATIATAFEATHIYTPIPQIAEIIYQTEAGTQLDGIDTATGKPGESINYSTADRINAYEKAGYELVSDGGPQTGQDATYDYTNDDATNPSQKFYVVLKERVVDIPKDVVPGQPVDPGNPDGPKWPAGVDNLTLTEEVTRTITYVDKDGKEVATTFKDTVTFTRTAKVNLVTGEITYSDWTADKGDNVLDGNALPEVAGYTASTATKDGADVTPESTTVYAQVTADSADIVEKVVYVQDTQTAKITISTVDANGANKTEYASVTETGKATEPIATQIVEEKLLELKRKGYDVETKVTDTFLDSAKTFDNVKDTADQPSQSYEIVVKSRIVDIPKDVVPGQPVDPTDPNSPVWPDSVKDLVTTEEVTRTIKYEYKDGTEAFATVTETKEFKRTASINLVTGEITYGDWTPAQDFEAVTSPLLAGYIADIKEVPTSTVNAEDADIEIVVTYKKLGSWVPKLPEGETPVPPITYPNDPKEDPTIPGQPTPTPGIPEIPGYVPVGPDGNELPKDPKTGHYIPPVPVDPTVDTPIRYVKQEQQATITFVNVTDPANPVTLVTIPLDGVTGDQFGYDTDPVVANYQKAGYTVTNKDNYSKEGVYSADPNDHDKFVFELVQRVEVVDPNDPNTPTPKPGEPVDPTDPNSPVWPETVKDLVTTEEVTRIISYVDNQGNTVFASVTDTKKFTRTAEINLVTGVITYGEWTAAQTLPEVKSPDKENHLVSIPVVGAQEVTAVDPDIHVQVVYTPLGSWVPVVPPGYPDVPKTVYPVDPEDPTKPGTDVPTIPYIPGIVPTIPNPDNPNETIPLQPVDPNDPTKGYVVPPVPEDPSQDTPITYELADQTATVNYVDEKGNPLATSGELTGKSGEVIKYSTTPTIEELLKKGYELVSNDFPEGATYDKDAAVDQVYTVVLKEKVVPVNPTDPNTPTPKPGEPVDPTDPNSPVWPDTVKDLVTTEEVTRTISYVDNTGKTVFETVTETKKFTRTADINLITGEITYGEWTPTQTFEDVTSPSLANHLVDTPVVAGQDVNPTDPDINVTVVYTPLGSWVPVVPPGFPEVPPTVYPVDPKDPTKPGTDVPTVPNVPGTTPVTPDPENPGKFIPLTPVDPEDPNKGYTVPPVPTDPTKDTPIVYVEDNKQLASVTIVDESTGQTISTFFEQGKPGFTVGINTADKLAELAKAGYTVTSDDYNDSAKVYDKDDNVDQAWTIKVTPRIEPVDPTDPNTPTPKPGEPVDPTDPNSPVWPDSVKDLVTTQEVVRTITYVNEAGETVSAEVVQKVSFTRTAQVNLVTGEVTYGEWTAAQELPAQDSPVVAGHYTETVTVAAATVNAEDADITVKVIYKKLGNWVPNVPGEQVPPIPYPNHPTDPSKPGVPTTPVVPVVPGYVPVGPDGNELPKDPNGNYIPPTPEKPGEDTPINYVADEQKATVNYVDENGNPLATSGTLTGKSDEVINYSTTPTIEEFLKKGYELVTDGFPTGATYDKDKSVDQVFTVTLKAKVVPVDPTDPNTPTPKPGEPVDPTDPNSPVWPDSVKDLVTTQEVVRTITYVNEAGETVSAEVVQKVSFTRTAQVNLVTGEITYGEWTAAQELPAQDSPVVAGYYTETVTVAAATVNAEDADITEKVVYKKLGNWVPNIPGQPVTPIPYPNHPTDPSKPGVPTTPVVPVVPGYVPVGPDGNELPKDPNGNYIPPVPTNPGEDTPITYIPVKPGTPVVPPVTPPAKPDRPVSPETPEVPARPEVPAKPAQPAQPASPAGPVVDQLPNTGESNSTAVTAIGASMLLAALALAGKRRRQEEE